jgi:lipopolysaccharide biosynthesis glycosyltransferase
MNIICSTDNNFVQHCSVMLTSVLINNEGVSVWLLTEGLTKINQTILKDEVESKGGILNYVKVDSEIISKLPMPKNDLLSHISPATYYRLLMSDLLPFEVHKAIYLDCDIIVRGSLMELWNTDISNFAIGAVHQMWNEVEDANRLGYPVEYGYFNAGMLLVNLDYWRENSISVKLVDYLTSNYETILMHDQDALNAILYDKAFRLPCKWNMLHYFFYPDSRNIKGIFEGRLITDYLDYKEQLKHNRNNPIIVHYVSKPKPWQEGCLHPFVKEYFNYAKKTKSFRALIEPNWVIINFKILINQTKITMMWILRTIYYRLKTS